MFVTDLIGSWCGHVMPFALLTGIDTLDMYCIFDFAIREVAELSKSCKPNSSLTMNGRL
jgi:hypothetical protein